jgi:hypothetical protein
MKLKIPQLILFCVLNSPIAYAQEQAREWVSKKGTKVTAQGLSVDFYGVVIRRSDSQKELFLKHSDLSTNDSKHAISKLPIRLRSLDGVRFQAKTIGTYRENFEEETGRHFVRVPVSTSTNSSGTTTTVGGRAKIVPETRKESTTSKAVAIERLSQGEGGTVAIDFFVITKSNNEKVVSHQETAIFTFPNAGTKAYFITPELKDYLGWSAQIRNIESGKLIQTISSAAHLTTLIDDLQTETVKYEMDQEKLRNSITTFNSME